MLSVAMSHRRSDVMLSVAKHLALVWPFHAKTQSQILRCAQHDSERAEDDNEGLSRNSMRRTHHSNCHPEQQRRICMGFQ
jgi:hypothetical protein